MCDRVLIRLWWCGGIILILTRFRAIQCESLDQWLSGEIPASFWLTYKPLNYALFLSVIYAVECAVIVSYWLAIMAQWHPAESLIGWSYERFRKEMTLWLRLCFESTNLLEEGIRNSAKGWTEIYASRWRMASLMKPVRAFGVGLTVPSRVADLKSATAWLKAVSWSNCLVRRR